jgi:hypothetical protein
LDKWSKVPHSSNSYHPKRNDNLSRCWKWQPILSIPARKLTSTERERGSFFFTDCGSDYNLKSSANKTLFKPTKTLEIKSLGINLQITCNSIQEPIEIKNQYSKLFGVIAIIDATTTTPNVQEYLIGHHTFVSFNSYNCIL